MEQTPSSAINSKGIVLDPTALYDIPPEYTAITTEVEWIKHFGISEACWVKGKRLCAWAQAWLQAWNRIDAIAEIKLAPRVYLETLFAPVRIPDAWSDEQILALATQLERYPQQNAIAYLLADITNSNPQIWLGEASISNLAAWAKIQVPAAYCFLEKVWQHQFPAHELATYYKTEDKSLFLRRWLGIAEPVITTLNDYPLPIPDFLTSEFDSYWKQQLLRSEGKVLDTLPQSQVGMKRIATCAYNILSNRPQWITQAREKKVAAYLTHQQQIELDNRQPPSQPQPLHLEATPQSALHWVTKYLPFRRWEVRNPTSSDPRISDRLAASFVEWLLHHYPKMIVEPVENSYLNYSVASKVQNCQSPVLWVVVDGLGWLDHIELLSILTKDYNLALETAIQPLFSILPTKTEYAKWSLYAQLLPNSPHWVNDVSKGFAFMGKGKRYTDAQIDKLYTDLNQKAHQLYCWDTNSFDELYHNQRDWQSFDQLERPHSLTGIAKKIDYCLQQYPHPDELTIVIASDHGQIMGTCDRITYCPPELEPKGRMAIGKTEDSRFVVLDASYGLPHDISVVRGSATNSAFSYTASKKVIGAHGGLFPEEVVVGVSVLRKSVVRLPVIVSCCGEAKPQQPGELTVNIDNPNAVLLSDLCLYIQELPNFKDGKVLEQEVFANQKLSFNIKIPEVPQLPPTHKGDRLFLSGKLTFRFANAETGSATISDSFFIVNQIFRSGFDIDDLL